MDKSRVVRAELRNILDKQTTPKRKPLWGFALMAALITVAAIAAGTTSPASQAEARKDTRPVSTVPVSVEHMRMIPTRETERGYISEENGLYWMPDGFVVVVRLPAPQEI